MTNPELQETPTEEANGERTTPNAKELLILFLKHIVTNIPIALALILIFIIILLFFNDKIEDIIVYPIIGGIVFTLFSAFFSNKGNIISSYTRLRTSVVNLISLCIALISLIMIIYIHFISTIDDVIEKTSTGIADNFIATQTALLTKTSFSSPQPDQTATTGVLDTQTAIAQAVEATVDQIQTHTAPLVTATPPLTPTTYTIWSSGGPGILSIAISSNGNCIAVGKTDGTIHVWEPGKNIEQVLKTYRNRIQSLVFSPDDSMLIFTGDDGVIRLWEFHDPKKEPYPLYENSSPVNSLQFHPANENLLAFADDEGQILVLDIERRDIVGEFVGHEKTVRSITFNMDGNRLASGSEDDTVRLWDTNTYYELRRINEHQRYVTSVDFNPDGTILASAGWGGKIYLWNTATWARVGILEDHTAAVEVITFHPTKNILASGGDDRTVKLWDIENQTLYKNYDGYPHYISAIAFMPDGNIFIVGGENGLLQEHPMPSSGNQPIVSFPNPTAIPTYFPTPTATIAVAPHQPTGIKNQGTTIPAERGTSIVPTPKPPTVIVPTPKPPTVIVPTSEPPVSIPPTPTTKSSQGKGIPPTKKPANTPKPSKTPKDK